MEIPSNPLIILLDRLRHLDAIVRHIHRPCPHNFPKLNPLHLRLQVTLVLAQVLQIGGLVDVELLFLVPEPNLGRRRTLIFHRLHVFRALGSLGTF